MNLQEILKNPPKLHISHSSGSATSWQISDEILHFIDQEINESSMTLETGSGLTTIPSFVLVVSSEFCILSSQHPPFPSYTPISVFL